MAPVTQWISVCSGFSQLLIRQRIEPGDVTWWLGSDADFVLELKLAPVSASADLMLASSENGDGWLSVGPYE